MNPKNSDLDEQTGFSKPLEEMEAHDLLWDVEGGDLDSLENSQDAAEEKVCPPGRAYERYWEMEDGEP